MSEALQRIEQERAAAQVALNRTFATLNAKQMERRALSADPANAAQVAALDTEIAALQAAVKAWRARRQWATTEYQKRESWESADARRRRRRALESS